MLRLTRLTLTDFRSYGGLIWQPASRVSVVSGANGSGKTNLLEAVSLLVPGRGLRGARQAELARRNGPGGWAVAARLLTDAGETDLGTGVPADAISDRRQFRVDGLPPRSQADIASRIAAVWLTPQMDRLFGEAASGRRRFLDRLVWALEPGHARDVAAHDTAMAGRNRLLAAGGADPAWLAGLEDGMARHAVAAAAGRAALVARLNARPDTGGFPPARLRLIDPVAERLATEPALAVEDWLRDALAANRMRDAQAGSAALGAHRADMGLVDAETGQDAADASTGQQKALLIGVVLGHAALMGEARGHAPLLLLDEPAVHLDATRRRALFAAVSALPAQVLITGTDADIFHSLRDVAEGLITKNNALSPDPAFPPPDPSRCAESTL